MNEIIMTTPCNAAGRGCSNPAVLVATNEAGADKGV